MFSRYKSSRLGFTLIELAIVLSIIGLMTAGLWRLLSSGNTQVKDSATSGQQLQLISAAKSFLVSTDGQSFLGSKCVTAGGCTAAAVGSFSLPLPASAAGTAACYGSALAGMTLQQTTTWCTMLPLGFSTATINSYGQIYAIRVVWNSPTTSAAATPSAYSFMILTSSGDTIPDPSGGHISSQIGGDGGFIYSTAICPSSAPAASNACGAYGAWYTAPVANYGFGSSPTGHIASQTYYASDNTMGPWLARINIGTPATYNTMFTTMYLGGQTLTGTLGAATDASNISLSGNGNTTPLSLTTLGTGIGTQIPAEKITVSGCVKSNPSDTGCTWGLQIVGDATVTNILNANVFYSNSDIRLKNNIRPLPDALDNIMRLKPVEFTFKSNGAKSLGLIAQDLDKVYPQLVSHGDENSMKSVNYEGLIAPLISAVQELKHSNDELRDELRQQQARQRELEKKIETRAP